MQLINSPLPVYYDRDGTPLTGGYLYLGMPNLNPETDPVAVYWDAAGTQPAAQPIRTQSGLPTRNGVPARIYVADDYSLNVRNRKGELLYYLAAVNGLSTLATLLSGATGTANVGFLQAGTGAVARTAQDKLREVEVNVEDFGSIGNTGISGDDSTYQKALNYMHKLSDDSGAFGVLTFDGTINLMTSKNYGKNFEVRGRGRNFRSVIKPSAGFVGDLDAGGNAYLFGIDGDECIGGYAFRLRHKGFTIDNSAILTKAQIAKTYYINKAYDVLLRDVWLYNVQGTAIEVGASNLIIVENPSIYGTSNSALASEYGIRVISAGAGGGGGGVKIVNPDIEVFFNGISQEGDSRVEVLFPYMERNIVGWVARGNSSGKFDVLGGQVESPGASGTAASIAGPNVSVNGGTYKANGGLGLSVDFAFRRENVKIRGVAGDVSDTRNYADKEVADTARWYPSTVKSEKDPASGVATSYFTIAVPFATSHFASCEVELMARDQAGWSSWTGRYRFSITNPGGIPQTSPIVALETHDDDSPNYSLTVVCALVVAGTTVSFRVTATTGGAIGAGIAPQVSCKAELVQWDSAGGVYIQAV